MEAERRAGIVDEAQLEPVAEDGDSRRAERGCASAITLVIRSRTTMTSAAARTPGARRRAPTQRRFPSSSFSLHVMQSRACGSASSRSKLISCAALVAVPELVGRAVEPAQRLVHVPEVAALLRGEEELLLPLHGVGALIGHVERVGRQVAVGRLERRVERLVVIAELLHDAGPLLQEPLLQMRQLLLVHSLIRGVWSGPRLAGRPRDVALPPPPPVRRSRPPVPGPVPERASPARTGGRASRPG